MNRIVENRGLTFDDVLLVPGYSDFLPDHADLKTRFSRKVWLNVPLVSAAMDTVTESAMAIAMAREGGIGIIHRNLSLAAQAEQVSLAKQASPMGFPLANLDGQGRLLVGAAIGVSQALERAVALVEAGVDVLVIDTAHGHSKNVMQTLTMIKRELPQIDVVAGNIATPEAALALIEAGADGLKVGIGPGSICTTRIVSGVGVPQISALLAVSEVAGDVPVVADGGICYSGDIPKAIAAGAESVMIGGLFARTLESPGREFLYGGRRFKEYRGMGSLGALTSEENDRYGKSAMPVPEGVEGQVPLSGTVADLMVQLLGGLRKGMGYTGLSSIATLRQHARFIRVTSAAYREAHAHNVTVTKETPNYSQVM